MLQVLHFDYMQLISREVSGKIRAALSKYPDIHYTEYEPVFTDFMDSKEGLEALLPTTDVLLIHCGVLGQKSVIDYPDRFFGLKVAFVIPGALGDYFNDDRIPFFGYKDLDHILEFILRAKEEKEKRQNAIALRSRGIVSYG